jgi:hypothetical protein
MKGHWMESISDLRISGIDEMRPPLIRKEPYINLFFKLSHQAPKEWCEDFNTLVSHGKYPATIDTKGGLYVETWVRKPEEIQPLLDDLKQAVRTCSEQYMARIKAAALAAAQKGVAAEDESEQAQLNRIVDALNFDD